MNTILDIVTLALLCSLGLVTFRLLRGPSIPDRAVAGDMVAIHVVALIVIYSIASKQSVLIDLVMVTAIVGFISTGVIGVYLERAERGQIHIEPDDQPAINAKPKRGGR